MKTKDMKLTAAAKAKNIVTEQIVKDSLIRKGPTMAEFIRNPRPLMVGNRDVS